NAALRANGERRRVGLDERSNGDDLHTTGAHAHHIFGADTLAFRHGEEAPLSFPRVLTLCMLTPYELQCEHATQTGIPLPFLSDTRTGHCASADVRVRAVCLQLGIASAHGRLL